MRDYRILVVDDDVFALAATKSLLEKHGFAVDTALSGEDGIKRLRSAEADYALVILDYQMGEMDGAETAEEILSIKKDIYILIHSGDTSQDAALSSWTAGAVSFIQKGRGFQSFMDTVKQWCKRYEDKFLLVESAATLSENEEIIRSVGMIGRSRALVEVAKRIQTYHKEDSSETVLIRGENGTGKELIARAIHKYSTRNQGPFVAINCAAIPESLVESELFGHEKGAFSGANQKKVGKFLQAHRGTLFLDEVGELSPAVQAKLLRALQERRITPVGANAEVPVDVRIVSATNRDLEQATQEGKFRQDLYYRLNVIPFSTIPLSARVEDIETLVLYFTEKYNQKRGKQKRFLAKTVRILERYSWPGNVRELENEVLKLLIFSPGDVITPEHLDSRFQNCEWIPIKDQLEEITRASVISALETSSSKREAARKLGIPFSTFRRMLKRFSSDSKTAVGAE